MSLTDSPQCSTDSFTVGSQGCWVRSTSNTSQPSHPSPPSSAPSPRGRANEDTSPTGRPVSEVGLRWNYSELTALKQKFQALDAAGHGFLSRQEFYHLFSSIVENIEVDSPMFKFAYSLFHSSGETLDLKQFVTGMTILSRGSEEERLKYLFLMYDTDNSGYLNADEIKQVFRIMSSYAKSHDFSASDSLDAHSLSSLRRGNSENMTLLATKTLAEHDMDNDGKIRFDDFSRWCSTDPVVKVWMDMLCYDTARGIEKLKLEREHALLARELDSLGFADNNFWRDSFNLTTTPGTSSSTASTLLPPSVGHMYRAPKDSNSSADTLSSIGETRRSIPIMAHSRSLTRNAIGTFEIDFTQLVFDGQIGSGSFATVWKCKWLDSPVAVKVFRSGPRLILNEDGTVTGVAEDVEPYHEDGESFDPGLDSMVQSIPARDEIGDSRGRFLMEVSLLKSIRHPNLLLYMGACVDPRYPLCIVSELIDGGSLFELLHGCGKVKLNLRQKIMLTHDIARGMLYLHGRDPIVLHRDLKSANILVEQQNDNSFKGKIIDFGLSKINSTQASVVPGAGRGLTGSLVTMAPEVMNEERYVTRSDVYSFGIVCWEIFCGRVPFGQFTQVPQLMMKVAVRGERPQFQADDQVPNSVQNMIKACWDQDTEKRPDFLVIVKMLNAIKRELELED